MKTWTFLSGLILLSSLMVFSGCGGGATEAPAPAESSSGSSGETKTSASVPQTAAQDEHRLVGVWLGVAYLDAEKLQAKLDGLTDEAAKQQLQAQAQTFQSMLVGTEFKADQTFTLDAEITPVGGQPTRQQSGGSWEIIEEVENMVMVQVTETKEDGSEEVTQKQYTFVDGDHFVWIPAVSPDLSQCDAMIAFERQIATEQVANEAGATETR